MNSANENVVIEDAEVELSGHSMREYSKLTYHLKFPKTQLLNLESVKLRSGENDKSMVREKLYVDLLNNIGVPAQQTTYVRMFWNGEPIGLFVAMEVLRENWVRKVLHPNITNVPVGSLWRMNASGGKEANLEWHVPATKSHDDIYDRYILMVNGQKVPKDKYMSDLIAFMKDLKDYDPKKTKDPIAYWQQRLDLDIFLKSMAMEYLTTAFDAYWQSGSNYQMYHDPVTKQWIWLPMDFDDTFSRDIVSYKKIPRKNEKGFESFLVSKLILDTPVINAKFEDHVKTITSYIFNPKALNPYLDAHVHMIEEDVAWDRKLPRVAKGGKTYSFKIEDLYKGVQDELKGWIKQRFTQIQKDMNFKSPTVVTNRVPPHNMHPMQLSVYGIKPQSVEPKKTKTPASVADAVPAPPNDDQKASDTENMKESATAGIDEKISNSASMTGSHWATLGALVAAVIFVA